MLFYNHCLACAVGGYSSAAVIFAKLRSIFLAKLEFA